MTNEALQKALSSSKVLIFLVFAVAITTALSFGLVDKAWYQNTLANAFYALMGGYSLVEAARALVTGKKLDLPSETSKTPTIHEGEEEKS